MTSGRISYKTAGGQTVTAIPVVPISGVDANGEPVLFDMSSTDLSNYYTKTQVDSALSSYVTASSLSGYLSSDSASSTYLTKTDAQTIYVSQAFLKSVEYSVTGDISVAGTSISIAFGDTGLIATLAYAAAGAASMTFYSTSGTLAPVDIRRNTIWGGSAVETFTLDNGSVGTDGVQADSTIYTNSQDSSAYFIRVAGDVYFLTIWSSSSGARSFMGVHKMI